MPPRHLEKVQSSEIHVSHIDTRSTEDFAQQLMEAMSDAGTHATNILHPSTRSEEREEEDRAKHSAPRTDLQNRVAGANPAVHWADSTARKRLCIERAPGCRKVGVVGSSSTTGCSTAKLPNVVDSTKAEGRRGCDTSQVSSRDHRSLREESTATGYRPQVRASRTEEEVLQQHGQLSQLNKLYLPRSRSCSRSSSTGTVNEKMCMEPEENRLRRRREELLQISPRNLSLYTRLAECGVDAVDRPFVTCVVQRSRDLVWAWASAFS